MTDAFRLLYVVALRIMAIALGLLFVANGVFMLVTPSAWFRLPEWFAPRSAHITPEKYASGWALELRLLGVLFICTPIWVVYDMFRSR
jgi:uncharacterized protein YjeT (DUF2065 family)